jgi:acyl-CoA reductase-like NAD-dependent aldehyde dehydrogenase
VAADIDLIAFTGSRAAGKHILAAAAGRLKRVILALGGKDPLLVLEDADLAQAAKLAARNSFRNAGQVCVSTERIYVDKKVADALKSLGSAADKFGKQEAEQKDTFLAGAKSQAIPSRGNAQIDALVQMLQKRREALLAAAQGGQGTGQPVRQPISSGLLGF